MEDVGGGDCIDNLQTCDVNSVWELAVKIQERYFEGREDLDEGDNNQDNREENLVETTETEDDTSPFSTSTVVTDVPEFHFP